MGTRRTNGAWLGRASIIAAALVAALGSVTASSAAGSDPNPKPPPWELHGHYAPVIDPADFVARIDNRYFPLQPGTTFHYRGFKGNTPQTDDMVVMHRTKQVLGVTCTVVKDTVSQHGKPLERTFDWYAQDTHGNVWYMGEDSLELEHGRFVRADDSWEAGVDGARPGIIMPGNPHAGQVYRQEYYPPGGALDQARVVSLRGSTTVPYGTFERSLVTVEWSPVEPQYEQKAYAAGVGEIEEHVTQGGHERFALARVTRHP
jgi:hypothetical protein